MKHNAGKSPSTKNRVITDQNDVQGPHSGDFRLVSQSEGDVSQSAMADENHPPKGRLLKQLKSELAALERLEGELGSKASEEANSMGLPRVMEKRDQMRRAVRAVQEDSEDVRFRELRDVENKSKNKAARSAPLSLSGISEPGHTLADCPATHSTLQGTAFYDAFYVAQSRVCSLGYGAGDDFYLYSNAVEPWVLAGDGNDCVFAHYWTQDAVVAGGNGHDHMELSDDGDIAWGQAGDDTIYAEYGNDQLDGGSGNDTLHGSVGNDQLWGRDGHDALWGEEHSDVLIGGPGNDLLVGDSYWLYYPGNDVLIPGPGRDEAWGDAGNDTIKILDICEVEYGEYLNGGPGYDTLITPVPVATLQSLGVSVVGFENIVIEGHSCESECADVPDCNGHGECIEGAMPGDMDCDCEAPFAGENCEECEPPFAGENCDECAYPFTGENCEECIPPHTGEACEECILPHTGEDCGECLPPFAGENCEECLPPFDGENCDECAYPFTGPNCEECLPPHSGPNCETCDNGLFGPYCVGCDASDSNACSGNGSCVPSPMGGHGNCDCLSGFVGPDCSGSVQDLSIEWNEGPETFEDHETPKPEDLGERSDSFRLDFRLDDGGGDCEARIVIPVDASGAVSLSYVNYEQNTWWAAEIRDQNGTLVSTERGPDLDENDVHASERSVHFEAASAQNYALRIFPETGGCPDQATLDGELYAKLPTGHRVLYSNFRDLGFYKGNSVLVEARLLDPEVTPNPTQSEEHKEPELWVQGEITTANLAYASDNSQATLTMVDNGSQGDRIAGDGIYSRRLTLTETGNWFFEIQVEGDPPGPGIVKRSQSLSTVVIERQLQWARPATAKDKNFSPDVVPPYQKGDRVGIRVPVDPVVVPLPSTDTEWQKLGKVEYVVSGQLWGIDSDDTRRPVAWVSGISTPSLIYSDPEPGSPFVIGMEFDFNVDAQWFNNLKRPGESLVDFEFHFEDFRMVDRKHQIVVDHLDHVPITFNPYTLAALDGMAPGFVDPTAPENKEMLEGAPPDFVQAIEDDLALFGYPGRTGDIYLVAGYCGQATESWEQDRILTNDDPDDHKDANGVPLENRLKYAELWFASPGKKRIAVSLNTFADELVADLRDGHDTVASVWGMSQGGASVLEMNQRWTPIHAYRGQAQALGLTTINTLTAPFHGTPLATSLLGSFLRKDVFYYKLVAVLSRIGARLTRNCGVESIGSTLLTTEFMSLAPIPAAIRLCNTPVQVRRDVSYGFVRQGDKGGLFGFVKEVCALLVSRFMLFSHDDGLVPTSRADLKHARDLFGGSPKSGFCHAERSVANLYWQYVLEGGVGTITPLCLNSPIGTLDPEYCR